MPLWTRVDRSSVTLLDFKISQLFKRASHHRTIDEADQNGLQFGMEKFEQITSADGIDQHRTAFDRPPFGIHAIAVAGDVQADHAHPERLEQHLGVSRIIAQIGNDQRIGIVAAVARFVEVTSLSYSH